MSLEKPNEVDREVIALIKWIRENFLLVLHSDNKVWLREGYSFYDDAILLHEFKKMRNAKH